VNIQFSAHDAFLE